MEIEEADALFGGGDGEDALFGGDDGEDALFGGEEVDETAGGLEVAAAAAASSSSSSSSSAAAAAASKVAVVEEEVVQQVLERAAIGIVICRECGTSMKPKEDRALKKIYYICPRRDCAWRDDETDEPCLQVGGFMFFLKIIFHVENITEYFTNLMLLLNDYFLTQRRRLKTTTISKMSSYNPEMRLDPTLSRDEGICCSECSNTTAVMFLAKAGNGTEDNMELVFMCTFFSISPLKILL